MGNLQTILGDCQLGEVPAYLQQYIRKGESGDEAYMVYNERSGFRRPGDEDAPHNDASMYYSGPAQQVVRAKLLEEQESRQRQVLADLVDLCVDGIDDTNARGKSALSGSSSSRVAQMPGGQVFSAPKVQREDLTSEVWSDAAAKGPVRATPWDSNNAQNDSDEETAHRKKSKKKSSKKKKSKRHADLDNEQENDREQGEISGRVEAIVNSYPEPIKELLRKDSNGRHDKSNNNSSDKEEVVDPDADYESEVESTDPLSAEHTQSDATRYSGSGKPVEADKDSVGSGSGMMNVNSNNNNNNNENNSSNKEQGSLRVHREEESKLFARLNIIVAPFEEPNEPIDDHFLLDAEWFRDWSAFLKGAARPGPIENGKLLDGDGKPWPGLDAGQDYVGIDKVGWNLLKDIYGADCAIIRPVYDLYA
mmetsp:Transcript_8965/g.17660  ORF Transcript_8965/g.17660 Transcript_8965/m.17660 type:complete len:421 (-) Transcript_8965:1302-2564(-)|eukprot:CAMPEP_0171499312 /NCGR_PEP_ID=MMETSP0958-20121227/8364_1 /TAXON_ID=87120 /ORGANISM="Aurantiochytrium limacinum, Strain ATCCMYA-1381" /LENGTH=420 /DNA_ID=CAMNT_0012033865 /DNA_START=242 /DNA_END=1504 /DNA_ORIENTATION=-